MKLILLALLPCLAFTQIISQPGSGSGGGGSGTVTSVSFTGGLISVATATSTPALTVAGTSGGIPYFSSTSTWASSALLTNHGVLLGGGAGASPTALAVPASGTLLTGVTGADPAFSATPILGVAGTTAGTLRFSGVTSGVVTVQTAAAAGTWSLTLPITGGTSGYFLQTNGSGVSTWAAATACATCVTSAAALTSTAIMTGAGLQASQTPSATTTLDSSGNISTPGSISTGVGGSVAGYAAFGQGTVTAAPTSSVGFVAPTSVSTAFMMILPAAPTTGFLLNTGTSDPSTLSIVAGTGTGSVVRANSPTLTGTPAAPTPATTDNGTTIATTAYVTTGIANAVAAVNPAVAVQVATAAVLPNSPTYSNGVSGIGATLTSGTMTALVVDGYTVLLGDRILVKNQAAPAQNGVYTMTTLGTGAVLWILTRALDFDAPSDMNNTGLIPVDNNGTVNAKTGWYMTSIVTTVGTDAVTFTQFAVNSSNIVTASSPGVGLAHFAGSTQTATSSLVVNADITNGTIDLTTKVTGVLPTANIAVALANQTSLRGNAMAAAAGDATIAQTIAHGAKALATSAISSAACSSAQTATATGTATTDIINATFNGDPTAVTGYVPLTTGMLTIIAYPTADTVNFKVCNNTGSSITPGAITLNWTVTR